MKIENWLHRRFGDVLPYGDGTDLRVDCPFCMGGDDGRHLHVSLVKHTCHCFKCDYSASWIRLVMDVDGVTYSETLQELKQDTDIVPLYKLRRQAGDPAPIGMPDNFWTLNGASLDGALGVNVQYAKRYVRLRLRGKVIGYTRYHGLWGVWAGEGGYGKLVFPVERGWWQMRHILPAYNGPKYVSCKHPKEDRLYNYTALEKYPRVYITEGIISAVCIGMDAIALCGKCATPGQAHRLGLSNVKTYIICLDAKTAEESLLLAKVLSSYNKEVILRKYSYGDPASCQEYEELPYNFSTRMSLLLG